jgi:hypothetical protein
MGGARVTGCLLSPQPLWTEWKKKAGRLWPGWMDPLTGRHRPKSNWQCRTHLCLFLRSLLLLPAKKQANMVQLQDNDSNISTRQHKQ